MQVCEGVSSSEPSQGLYITATHSQGILTLSSRKSSPLPVSSSSSGSWLSLGAWIQTWILSESSFHEGSNNSVLLSLFSGAQGEKGSQGDSGLKGDRGPIGPKGETTSSSGSGSRGASRGEKVRTYMQREGGMHRWCKISFLVCPCEGRRGWGAALVTAGVWGGLTHPRGPLEGANSPNVLQAYAYMVKEYSWLSIRTGSISSMPYNGTVLYSQHVIDLTHTDSAERKLEKTKNFK